MKKLSFAIPIVFLSTILNSPMSNVNAAACNSHKAKSVEQECLKEGQNCSNDKLNKNQNKVDV
tara:strand:+ start:370 stop:558 length:189 start_codon:yes stop_codon:yes gene_type:complete